MTNQSPQLNESRAGGRRPLRGLAIAALSFVAGLMMALLALIMLGRAAQSWPGGLLGSWFQRTARTDLSQPTVVDRIQKLQRLETVVYTMDKIVTGEKESVILPTFLAGDRLLLLVHGEVIAGSISRRSSRVTS